MTDKCGKDDCDRDKNKGSKFCNLHNPTLKANVKAAAKSDRAAKEKAALDKIAKDRLDAISVASAQRAAKAELERVEQINAANQAKASFDVILNLAAIVRAQRLQYQNPDINAGKNAGVPDTVGGTETAYVIVSLPGSATAEPGAIRAHLLASGKLENSFSGYLKYRSPDNIFIHVA